MSLLEALKLAIVISVVMSVISLALRARADDVLYMTRHPADACKAFASMYLVVPALALAAVLLIQPRPGVTLALLVLSFSPVPPLLPKKQMKSGGDGNYVIGLLVFAAVASLVLMPLVLPLVGKLFGREFHVAISSIVRTLGITIAAPLLLGFAGQKLLKHRAERFAETLSKIGQWLLIVAAATLLVILAPGLWRLVGHGTLAAMIVVILGGWAAGYVLGGPTPSKRSTLGLASATRHPGVAMGVVGSGFPDAKLALLAILIFVLLNVVVGIPFVKVARSNNEAD